MFTPKNWSNQTKSSLSSFWRQRPSKTCILCLLWLIRFQMCCTSLKPKRCFGQGAAQLSINFFLSRNHVRSLGFFAVSSICVTLEWVDHLHLWLSESKQSVKMDRRKIGLVTLILATHVWHTGYIIMINSGPIPWKSLRQENVSLSTSEAKFVPASQTGQVAMCLRETLKDFAGLSIDDNHQNLWRHSGTCSHDWKTPNFFAPERERLFLLHNRTDLRCRIAL